MATIDHLLAALDERQIAQRVGLPHDEARMEYPLRRNTVGTFEDFTDLVADYYNHHFARCVSGGGSLPRPEAAGRAKEALEREYRRRNGDIVAAFNDAHDGTNGGLRVQLDLIAEALKTESVERYIRDMFDRYVAPNSWVDKVEIIRQFIARCGGNLAASIGTMFTAALTHRPGFLVNSEELTSLVHLPPPKTTEHLHTIMTPLETLPASAELDEGTPIGVCWYAGTPQPVCIPSKLRENHVHVIGGIGSGKSTLVEHMSLHDIRQNHGVAVLDPHGRLVERLLCLIPEEFVERVIYVDPGDPKWVPLWNPLQPIPGQDPGRMADDLVLAFKKIVFHWGDRLENLLREAFFAALNLPGSTFLDISNLMRNKTDESRRIRQRILQVVDNEVAREFWLHDFEKYGKDDLGPPKNKLSKLLLAGTVSLMLSQPESRFAFPDIMERGQILLVNLSTIGSQVREILGCFFLELMRLTALGRDSADTKSLLPFHIYCDEAHRFLTDAMEDMIDETRKFGVPLTLAHQHMSQFNTRKNDALSGVGTTVIFRVNRDDAQHLTKDLRGKADLDDLRTLEVGQAIARIDNHVVRFKTRFPLEIPENHHRDRIVARSRELYCRPREEVRRIVRDRRTQGATFFSEHLQAAGPRGEPSTKPRRSVSGRPARSFHADAFSYDTY